MPEPAAESYAYVHATVEDGNLTLQYRLNGSNRTGTIRHDENVDGWSDRDIRECAAGHLDLSETERDAVEVRRW